MGKCIASTWILANAKVSNRLHYEVKAIRQRTCWPWGAVSIPIHDLSFFCIVFQIMLLGFRFQDQPCFGFYDEFFVFYIENDGDDRNSEIEWEKWKWRSSSTVKKSMKSWEWFESRDGRVSGLMLAGNLSASVLDRGYSSMKLSLPGSATCGHLNLAPNVRRSN